MTEIRTVLFSLLIVGLTACGPTAPPATDSVSQQPAQTPTPELAGPTASGSLQIPFEKYTLDNGLEVILHTDHSDPVVAVASIFHVGSSREEQGRTGFAHFFEHMSFNDSENVPRGANRKYIEELGGSRNGGTWSDGTVYYEVVPTDALDKILWIDSDRMGYMINTVTEEALEREKQVVKNEKRQRVDNAPYGHTGLVIRQALYPDGHPYSWTVIGSLQDLQNATLDDVRAFYDRWYGANNATLVIAGDFDPAVIKPKIEQWFGEIRRGPEVESLSPLPVTLSETRKLWYGDNFATLPELRMVFPTVEQYHEDSYALDVLGSILADTKRAPLYRVLVEEEQLAPEVFAGNASNEIAGEFTIRVRALEGTDLDDVEAAIEDGLARFEAEGFADTELLRIKAELETGFYQGLSGVLNKAFQLATYNEYAGDPGFVGKDIERMQAVTKEDVMRVYERYVKNRHFVQTSFVPRTTPELAVSGAALAVVYEEPIVAGAEAEVSQGEEAEYAKTPSQHDRSEPPLGPPPVLKMPAIWDMELANGMTVMGITDDEVPLVSFTLSIPGGQWLDLAERTGTARLMAELMMQGTANRTSAELEEAIGLLGATISFEADADGSYLSGSTLARNLAPTLELAEEILLEPRWDVGEFERLRREALASIAGAEANPNSVASRIYYRLLYGDHPYGTPVIGTRETVTALTLQDLTDWYDRNLKPENASLQIVGDVDPDDLRAMLSDIADHWVGAAPEMPVFDLADAPDGGNVYFIDVPDAKQSVIRVGKRAISANDPDWSRLRDSNQRLGGGTSARLTQLLRIEKGYTYGAYSWLGQFAGAVSPWQASTSVRANVTAESMELIRDQVANYAETFTDEDAATTRNQILKRNSRSLETLSSKLGLLNRIAGFDLPRDIIEREQAALLAMDTEAFRAVIAANLNVDEMIWVVVGDGATQREPVAEFAPNGTIVELDRQGDPIH